MRRLSVDITDDATDVAFLPVVASATASQLPATTSPVNQSVTEHQDRQ